MQVGVTGTRYGMTEAQKQGLAALLEELKPDVFHHGDCVGADDEAANLADATTPRPRVVCHPPDDDSLRACNSKHDEVRDKKSYFARNRQIVSEVEALIVIPWQEEWSPSGGTWYTHDYAVKRKRSVFIIWPDGRVQRTPALKRG
jgi:hypothetical protein